MSQNSEIFSIRLVIADFYLEKPLRGLDPCYSEFRGKEIKKVPILRIFGSNRHGQKTCMHVHGVFPYLYIPYESKDFESLNKAIYQIAFNLDKAINISLGQTHSETQHVFKVQLVKGIPFYGYHRREHQYLKIYMYNPRFVRRAANLLQNGSVLGKVFHPHESHVPYVLQFMIDYNLYGMSFLHVPLDIVKLRRTSEEDKILLDYPFKDTQILSTMLAKKQSCCALEVDISSNFILNRFQLVAKNSSSKHSNPGIEAIWNDEDIRRQNLISGFGDEEKISAIPPLEIPESQERPNVQPTESEAFYRVGLLGRLAAIENSLSGSASMLDQTLNTTELQITPDFDGLSKKEKHRTFNLKKLLANSVYPEECSPDEQLMDASSIEDHLGGRRNFPSTSSDTNSSKCNESEETKVVLDEADFLDNTIVEEDMMLNKTQDPHVSLNATLRVEDVELLDVLQQLEEENEFKNPVDLDSSLAPLSQPHKVELTPDVLDKETKAMANSQVLSDNESGSDNEGDIHFHDFSIALDDIDELILKLSQSQTADKVENTPKDNLELTQMDGTDDTMSKTPEKVRKNQSCWRQQTTPPQSPKTPKNKFRSPVRSPRTPKSSAASKYAPLPLVISNRSAKKTLDYTGESPRERFDTPKPKPSSPISLRKTLAISKMRRKTISSASELIATNGREEPIEKECEQLQSVVTTRRSRKTSADLEKTHITCSLTPIRRSERLLKFCNMKSAPKNTKGSHKNIQGIEKKSSISQDPKQKRDRRSSKQTDTQSIKDPKQTPYVLKKVLVRLPKQNLVKLAEDFKRSRQKIENWKSKISEQDKKMEVEHRDVKNINEREISEDKELNQELSDNPQDKREFLQNSKDNNPTILENPKTLNNIRNNLSQLVRAFQTPDELSDTSNALKSSALPSGTKNIVNDMKSTEQNIGIVLSKAKNLKLCGTARRSPLSLSRYRIKSDKNVIATQQKPSIAGDIKSLPEDNIRKNLTDLVKVLQTNDQSNENKTNFLNFDESGYELEEDLSQICDNSLNTLMLNDSMMENLYKDDKESDEEIAGSDTEGVETLSQLKGTPSLKRLRRSFYGTPKLSSVNSKSTNTPSNTDIATPKFCDFSVSMDSPSIFSECSSPVLTGKECVMNNSDKGNVVILEPLLKPPTREETLKTCEKLQIYEYEFPDPFYSNPDDLTKAKEIGFTVLQIPGNKLNDLNEFQSVLGTDVGGLISWRRKKLIEIGGDQMIQQYRTAERMREFFATKRRIIIQPKLHPPSRYEAKLWLKARQLLENRDNVRQKEKLIIDQDSPIKIKRQKITMILNDETDTGNDDGDDMDQTSCSLTLTPLTPVTPFRHSSEQTVDSTPLTTVVKDPFEFSSSSKKRKRRPLSLKSVKKSLNEKLKAAAEKEMSDKETLDRNKFQSQSEKSDSLPSSQHSNYSSNDSSSISSQVALAELDRLSFVKRLQIDKKKKKQLDVSFGLNSSSLNDTFGFKVNLENLQQAKADVECNNLTTIVMELFVETRDDLYPNPECDGIRCIFYAIENNTSSTPSTDLDSKTTKSVGHTACGYILVNDARDIVQNEGKIHGIDADIEVKIVKTEVEALEALLDLCRLWDPDIFAGYEIEMSSWGYLIDRAQYLCLNIAPLLSRIPSQKINDFTDEDREQHTDLDFEMKLCGRILLDVWRLMRSEIALTSYTFENVMYHILHKRCPMHSYRDLTIWFKSPCSRWIVLEYYLERVRGIMALFDQLDLLGRTSEMAKLIGIQFYEVLSRGSQFRVESMMLRIAKPRNLVPLSPSVQQRAHMRAPEYLPLILEPQSRFYPDPVIVLDFQSLYPSMIMAYNYCFSTCLGRVEHLGQSTPFEFGASQLRVSPAMLRKLLDDDLVTISPCGVVFVKASVREGILPRMLKEILDTRQMVKQSMKLHKSNSALQRILHSRQLGLKLMANVTYGYTAANYSGRMPAVEVGDSVVAKGRETLERTIKMVEANEKWGVKVVYGDTDSLFVLVPGRNRKQAFEIGEEIAAAATKDNPHPVKLKLEKVYQPCILQTKKRYVGYMYETPDQAEPVYEAKGIETVRRDGCPAVAKMLEKVLRILFETTDVSQVKQYVCRQFTKLLSGRANLQDLIFAKEFRGLNGYKPTACVPALELTRKWIQTDPRRIPRRGERVPFIITNGPPGVPLIRLVRSPYDVLADGGLKINAIYYITKAIIPPLNRCLLLIGADVNEWFASLPRKILMTPALSAANEIVSTNQQKKSTISQYFSTTNCVIECGRQTKEGICNVCSKDVSKSVITLNSKIAKIERAYHLTMQICQACCGRVGDLQCKSLDCPVLYVFEVKRRDLQQIEHFRKLLAKF